MLYTKVGNLTTNFFNLTILKKFAKIALRHKAEKAISKL